MGFLDYLSDVDAELDNSLATSFPTRHNAELPKGTIGLPTSCRYDPKVLELMNTLIAKRLDPAFKNASCFLRWALHLAIETYLAEEPLLDTPHMQSLRADKMIQELQNMQDQINANESFCSNLEDLLHTTAASTLPNHLDRLIKSAHNYARAFPETVEPITRIISRYGYSL